MGEEAPGRSAARAGKPRTRTQRRALAATLVCLVLGFVLALLWMPFGSTDRWVDSTPASGWQPPDWDDFPLATVHRYGVLSYAVRDESDVPNVVSGVHISVSKSDIPLRWRPPFLIATAVLTVAALSCAILGYRRLMTMSAVPGYCDRCAYPLTGLDSGRCPECGEDNPASTVSQ